MTQKAWTRNQKIAVVGSAAAVAAAVIAVVALIGGGSGGSGAGHSDHNAVGQVGVNNGTINVGGSTAPSGRGSTPFPLPRGVSRQRSLIKLKESNLCVWELGRNPLPVVSVRPLRLEIDDRCNDPEHADPRNDTPTGVFAAPDHDQRVGQVRDMQVVTGRCFSEGIAVSDADGNRSRIWLRLTRPGGFVPDVAVGGGFTAAQLVGLGLEQC